MRSRRGSIFTMKNQNKWLWGAGILSMLLTMAVVWVPFLADIFQFAHITVAEFAVAVGLAFLIIPIMEITKLIQRKISK